MTSKKRPAKGPKKRAARLTAPKNRPTPGRTDEDTRAELTIDRAAPDVPTVVGVGASAGGLEAFSQLLEALPASADIAVVFVQHLSPQHESALPSLLATRTSFPVVQVTEGLSIEPKHVYVIPPNVQMGITDGVLHLLPRTYDRAQFTPIDYFFQSLARWAHNRAIAVVLSGTASDGAAGIREIKAAGGITIAQTLSTAKYDGMPRSAIATGMVDLVLSPQDIAERLAHIPTHPYHGPAIEEAEGQPVGPTDAQMGEMFALLRRASGVDFRQYKTPTVRRRLLRRMALHRTTDPDTYVRYLRDNPKEVTALYQDLLIHVTRFFREPDSFQVLISEVFSRYAESKSEDEPTRIWVPGCATGEEAYSVAIALMEALGDQAGGRRIQIFATDVSESAIDHARVGAYPASISADVSPDRLKRFFTKADGGYKINKALRDVCVFARHDLTRDPPFSRLDLVVCRNVMIYLDAALQKRLISVFHYALKSIGFLMLGPAETTGNQHLFTVVDKRWRLYRKVAFEHAVPVPLSVEEPSHYPSATGRFGRSLPRTEGRTVHDEATRVMLQRYGPPSVVVDEGLQIVQFRGQTGRFLEPASGEPNLNLLKMAREGLLFPLRSALQQARRNKRSVRKEGVSVHRNGGWQEIDVEVTPLAAAGQNHFLISFEEAPEPKKRGGRDAHPEKARRKREGQERASELTRELEASRQYLQSIIQELEAANEELQSANEEILSSNEELQSTNEELDTAKEELQSTNEELNTVNEELHSRNEELSRVNSDLMNLLTTIDVTVLIVGEDLRIRRFTPTAERVLNLIPGDVGRPLGQINTGLVSSDLEGLTRETIDSVTPRELEVHDRQGRWYSLKIRPYKSLENRIDGAVLMLMDIAPMKVHQRELEQTRDQLLSTIDLTREPMLVVDQAMLVKKVNAAFSQTFGIESDGMVGMNVFELGKRRWNVQGLRALLDRIDGGDGGSRSETFEHDFGLGEPRRVTISARRIPLGDSRWTVLAFHDAEVFQRQQ